MSLPNSCRKNPAQFLVDAGNGFDMDDIEIPAGTELICTTQNETSTGVQIPVADLILLKQKYPEALLCTDLVSAAPYADIDYAQMDSSFFSVQKAFGMPPGLGVWIANDGCISKSAQLQAKGVNRGAHNTLEAYYKNYKQFETPSTPNVIAIYILGKIAEDMNRIGLKSIRKEIDYKAKMIYDFASEDDRFSCFVQNEKHRSNTVVVLDTDGSSNDIIDAMKQHGFVVGNGYAKYKGVQIRIANFPATSTEQMEELLHYLSK